MNSFTKFLREFIGEYCRSKYGALSDNHGICATLCTIIAISLCTGAAPWHRLKAAASVTAGLVLFVF